jgi:hypothetical protein
MTVTKRPHFVPQTYLRAWAGPDERVAYRRRDATAALLNGITNVAVKGGIYGKGQLGQAREDAFNELEKEWTGLRDELISQGDLLGERRRQLAVFMARFATLDSRRAAKTFLDTRTDPMEDLAEHFHWVLTQVGKPVMLLIDDLDRCPESHVVEVLETVQKLLRDRWTGTTSKLIILVAADGRWIRGSYDNTYATLANAVSDPGASIGSLFLQKLFQLTVPVPRLSNALREQYVEDLLAGRRDGVRRPGNTFLAAAIQQAGSGEQVLDLLASVSQGERIMVADEAIRRLVTDRQG